MKRQALNDLKLMSQIIVQDKEIESQPLESQPLNFAHIHRFIWKAI